MLEGPHDHVVAVAADRHPQRGRHLGRRGGPRRPGPRHQPQARTTCRPSAPRSSRSSPRAPRQARAVGRGARRLAPTPQVPPAPRAAIRGRASGINAPHASIHLDRRDHLRPGHRAREALQRRAAQDRALPPAQRRRPACASSRSASTRRPATRCPTRRSSRATRSRPTSYVLIEPDELEALEPKKTKTIEITTSSSSTEIDPIFYDHPYYLAPGAGRRQALPAAARGDGRDGRKVAIAKVVIRPKENLVAIRPMGRRARHVDDDLRRRGRRRRPHRRAAGPTTSRPPSGGRRSRSS